MRKRTLTREMQRTSNRKTCHEQNGLPPEFHEEFAPEDTPLPDEFNRFAPQAEAGDAQARHRHLMKMVMYLAAAGVLALGLFATAPKTGPSGPEPTQVPNVSQGPEATREATATQPAETPAPTAEPTAAPTPAPTPVPTPEPTEVPEVDGVELVSAEWVSGTGEGAIFRLAARVPKQNLLKGITFLSNGNIFMEAYAWIGSDRGVDDWDGIMTASEWDTTVSIDENGDMIAIMQTSMYWPNRSPSAADRVTIAVTGARFDADGGYQGETDPSDSLTVTLGSTAVNPRYQDQITP